MNNIRKMLMIIPSYSCDNHCNYCMYYDLTYDDYCQSIDKIVDTTKRLIDQYQFYGYAIGGGGDILKLGYDYCSRLIDQIEQLIPSNKYITLMTNVHSVDDVCYLDQMIAKHRIRLNISLNFERPNNKKTIELIKQFTENSKKRIRISTVVLNSVIRYGATRYFQLINDLGVEAVLFGQFEKTTMSKITQFPTDYQYFKFLNDAIIEWTTNRDQYQFDLPQAIDFLMQNGVYGLVDVIVDPFSLKLAAYDRNRVKRLIKIENIDQIDQAIKTVSHQIFDQKCLCCQNITFCDHKYTQSTIDENVCQMIGKISRFINNNLYGDLK